jgi:Na+/H+-dicarboxylate symporter
VVSRSGFYLSDPVRVPVLETASFFGSTLIEERPPFNFVDLFIPSNPFHALANNIVPAVVLFFIFFGVALIGVKRKQVALDVFNVDERTRALPEVIIPTSFNFPHTGKLLSISFILFASWFTDAAVPAAEYPHLALAGLLTFFGSLTVAVPFLLDLFRIPADRF